MAQTSSKIDANCKIIWGADTDYEIDIETDDHETWYCYVKRDLGTSFGPVLVATFSNSSKGAWGELERMLDIKASQKLSAASKSEGQQ